VPSVTLLPPVSPLLSLKKRKAGVHRQVPVPPELLDTLDMVHGIREIQRKGRSRLKERLWTWSRMTAWRKMDALIKVAGIPDGPRASPKGLRHGFGVTAVSKGIALNMVQKWLGHSQLTITAIYANAVGEEEQNIASRMWT
jgi:integrase/recombinase XerD